MGLHKKTFSEPYIPDKTNKYDAPRIMPLFWYAPLSSGLCMVEIKLLESCFLLTQKMKVSTGE
jgi:hypothetical protein